MSGQVVARTAEQAVVAGDGPVVDAADCIAVKSVVAVAAVERVVAAGTTDERFLATSLCCTGGTLARGDVEEIKADIAVEHVVAVAAVERVVAAGTTEERFFATSLFVKGTSTPF